MDNIHTQVKAKYIEGSFGFFTAQKSVIDKDAGKLVTNSLVDEGGDYCRINASGESTDDFTPAYLFFDSGQAILDEVAYCPVSLAATYSVGEILEDSLPLRGVGYLRVKLETKYIFIIAHNGDG